MFRGSVKSTGYSLHSPVSPSLPLPASQCAIRFQLDSSQYSRLHGGGSKNCCEGRIRIPTFFSERTEETHGKEIYGDNEPPYSELIPSFAVLWLIILRLFDRCGMW